MLPYFPHNSIYDLLEPDRPTQTIYLGDNEPSYTLTRTWPSTSSALGDHVVAFDFGTPVQLERKSVFARSGKGAAPTVWPLYCVRGNGDVVVAFSDISDRLVLLNMIVIMSTLNSDAGFDGNYVNLEL